MRMLHVVWLAVMVIGLTRPTSAMDPRNAGYEFRYSFYPPQGFSVKKSKAVMRADPKQPKEVAMIGADGKFTEVAQWYYAIGSDPKAFETWWLGYWCDTNNWKMSKTPVFAGTTAGNQGHRIIAWLGTFRKLLTQDPTIDAEVKQAFLSDDWKRAVEKIVGATVNDNGMLEHGGNKADMACCFHFIRTKFGALGLKFDNVYTLERAQNLIRAMLTEPWIICADDKYLAPPNPEYLEAIGKQKGGQTGDIRIVKDGKVLWAGGMFIGWKDKPSLHGTWDGLAIINSLFKYYPEPDPANPKSIFYKWNQLPDDKKQIGKQMIILCSRQLWLDWQENKGKTWCWVRDGKPTEDESKPSEAPFLPAYDGYGDNQLGWAKQCWEEMFGNPSRNTNDGVQSLLAIAHGKVHRDLKTPTGQQLPGRYDFDAQKDEPKLNPAKSKGVLE